MPSERLVEAADAPALSRRAATWASTMDGHPASVAGITCAHNGAPGLGKRAGDPRPPAPRPSSDRLGAPGGSELVLDLAVLDRVARERLEAELYAPGATRAAGAGNRARPEEPDPYRTCFERDRDRILHSAAFRRLAGKTQVFVFPADHQRTRLTHALEVAQVATAIARACRLNVALTEAIALGHDCGHGPGGHASEDAFTPLLPGGFDHAVWGADITAAPLNLCAETLDGIRNHSWSRPAPETPEGEVVALADRIAYSAHDLEDAVRAGIVGPEELPEQVTERCGRARGRQLHVFIRDVVHVAATTGLVGLSVETAEALAALRRFNYERIYLRPASLEQSRRVVEMLRALVAYYETCPDEMPFEHREAAAGEARLAAVGYVAGMTDRFACAQATARLGWTLDRLPRSVDGA